MTIRARLAIGLIAIAVILVLPLTIGLRSLVRLGDATEQLRDREFAASLLLGRIRTSLEELRRTETALLFVHDAESRDAMTQELARLSAMADSLDHYALDSAAVLVRQSVREVQAFAPLEFEAALAGRTAQAEAISSQRLQPAIARVERLVGTAERALRERTHGRVDGAARAVRTAQRVAAGALLLALAVTTLISIWLTRTISRPVRDLERGMDAVADGDFAYALPVASGRTDEFGRLATRFRSMSAQLAELDKLRAEFISIASHELKTPINVILGYVQLLEEGTFGPLTERQREVCNTLIGQTNSLARLVKHLLDVSRFEAGGGKLEPRAVDLRKLLADLEAAFQVLAHQRQITFRVCCTDEAPATVHWDLDRMNEVVGNLLSNAFKFTSHGGRVELNVASGDGEVQIEVRDSGRGIAPDQLPHVFKKFYQADNQEDAAHGGTGLGLAITKELVEAHGGMISVESTPGVGTAFTILLPVRAGTARATGARATAGSGTP